MGRTPAVLEFTCLSLCPPIGPARISVILTQNSRLDAPRSPVRRQKLGCMGSKRTRTERFPLLCRQALLRALPPRLHQQPRQEPRSWRIHCWRVLEDLTARFDGVLVIDGPQIHLFDAPLVENFHSISTPERGDLRKFRWELGASRAVQCSHIGGEPRYSALPSTTA